MDTITKKNIKNYSKKLNTRKNKLMTSIVSSIDIKDIKNRDIVKEQNNIFYKKIDINTKITNQKNSGRCWIFSFLNLLRLTIIQKYKLPDDFELSQNYLFFWDKLEKSNLFLKHIIDTKHLDVDDRLITHFFKEPTSDGGQWNMLINLIDKYGIIPKSCMKESFHSSNSEMIEFILNNTLREYAYEIRNKTVHNINIDDYLSNIYKILVYFLGEPPTTIDWKYYSENKKGDFKKYNAIYNISPLHFYNTYVDNKLDDYIVLINVPNPNRPFFKLYDLKYFGNVNGGRNTNYLNVPIDDMIDILKKSIDNNNAVWFGSDVDKYLDSDKGYLDNQRYLYTDIFEMKNKMNKGKRLEYSNSYITHAMLIRGYDIDHHKHITKWLVENSWGDENEQNGHLIMSNEWFKNYVYEIVVHKKFIPKHYSQYLTQQPILLEPWDPLGLLLFK